MIISDITGLTTRRTLLEKESKRVALGILSFLRLLGSRGRTTAWQSRPMFPPGVVAAKGVMAPMPTGHR